MDNKLIWVFLIFPFATGAQELIPLGQWRSHFNYDEARVVAVVENEVFCATVSALFSFDRSDNSLTRQTKVQGFSDTGISALNHSVETGWLIIGYENGNLDFFNGSEIVNFPVILQEPVVGSKQINQIATLGSQAYLATNFGVVALDVEQIEVRETYETLGPAGEKTPVRGLTILDGKLFLATDFGVIAGDISGQVNLLDFRNWERYTNSPVADQAIDFIVSASGRVIAATEATGIFILEGEEWSEVGIELDDKLVNLKGSGDDLWLLFPDRLTTFSLIDNSTKQVQYKPEPNPADVTVDNEGTLWIADREAGLFSSGNGSAQNFRLSGPSGNSNFKLFYHDEKIYALPGGYSESVRPLNNFEGYSVFDRDGWQTVETSALPFGNLTAAGADPNTGEVWITSFGDGLLNLADQSVVDENSPGSTLLPSGGERTTRVTGIGFDSNGNRWLANYNSATPLHLTDREGNWTGFRFDSIASNSPVDLAINEFDDIWMRLDPQLGGGIQVFNATTDEQRLLNTGERSGSLPHKNVTDVVFDREGQAWIGTAQGIAFFPNPFFIFEEDTEAIRPVFENRFLLKDDRITSLAVDGGNRKWIGTKTGLWLFEDAGEALVQNFTAANSPLPSDEIVDIEVHPGTGEVFISTSKGIVSFRSNATFGAEKHRDVRIFPNPVRPGFTGEIGISGLAQDAVVKITDIGGRLVREIEANGGTASWDTRDFSGRGASSGIYLVFSATPDGKESFVGKIAIAR